MMNPASPPKASMPCFKNLATLESEIRDRVSGKYNKSSKINDLQELVERLIT